MTENQRELFFWLGWMLEIGVVDDIPGVRLPVVEQIPSPLTSFPTPHQHSVSAIGESGPGTALELGT